MNEHPDPYAVLGVTPTATPAEITHAFRAKLRTLHPDTCSAAVSDGELRQVLAAYGLLRDPTAAPITTAPPPSPPRPRPHADQVRRRHGAHLRILLGQFRSRSHTTAKTRRRRPHNAHCGQGRCAGTPTAPSQPSQAAPMERCSTR